MSKSINSASAIIFDMDGLVLDTESTYCIAWQKASTEMGQSFTEQFCMSMSGLHYQDVEKRLIEACGKTFDLKQFTTLSGEYWREYVVQYGIPVKKGFFNLLSVIQSRNTPFCLATNSRKLNALECLCLAGLEDVFQQIITRDDVGRGKPEPDIFLAAAQTMATPITECLILEDSNPGIQAAVSSGAKSVYIPSVLPASLTAVESADFFADDLDKVIAIIA